MKFNLTAAIIFALAFICITISTVQTAEGFQLAFKQVPLFTWGISLIISIALGALNYYLYQEIRNNANQSEIFKYCFGYFLIAMFSFLANFNAFYSSYMEKTIVEDDLTEIQNDFSEMQSSVNTALQNKYQYGELVSKVTMLKTNLLRQVRDDVAPGIGPRAEKILKEINESLGVDVTIPYGNPYQQARSLDENIDEILSKKIKTSYGEAEDLNIRIKDHLLSVQLEIDTIKVSSTLADDYAFIDRAWKAYNDFGEEAEELINDDTIYKFDRKSNNNRDIGQIKHTLESARNPEYRTASVIMILLALLIDLITPIVIIIIGMGSQYDYYNSSW